ncbi:MAG TPA: M20/M25/M40 family metallo-hydrolase [Steroidobacteraceae bacterium]|nr:M20/M25/M40 family metallo-hydrolase [Steroidobacteraceae bacterium]
MDLRSVSTVCAALLCAASARAAQAAAPPAASESPNALARSIFQELIEINTTDSVGNITTASEAMAKRFRAAGFTDADMAILGPNARKKNLVVRLRGTGERKPVLLIGHLDVVEARREDWTTDPFKFVEKDGYFYGRGTQDMKDGDAIMVTTLIRLKKEGFKPNRDIILALTADEEGGSSNGVDWLLKNHRDLVDAEFVLNHDGSSIVTEHGKPLYYELDGTEKVYGDYQLTVTNPGGHSSLPVPDNAIYALAAGLGRVEKFEFPFELNTVTRGYYEQMATIETGQRAADMRAILRNPPDQAAIARLSHDAIDHSIMHTTCVATRLEGGHANNALPQRATAVVNCRILPGHSPEEVRQVLIKVLADPRITIRYIDDNGQVHDKASDRKGYPPPPLSPEIMKPLETLVAADWPGLKVVPNMSAGASDGVYTSAAGLPTYTITGVAIDKDNERAHGRDERLGVDSFYKGNEFFYQYIRAISSK